MRTQATALVAAIAWSLAAAASAQTAAPAADSNGAAFSTPGSKAPAPDANLAPTPAKGANSFSQSEAASRLAANGFANVSGLAKDADGIWRGSATKNGKTVTAWLDYTGAVGAQ